MAAPVVADGGHGVAFGDNEVEEVAAVGEGIEEGLSESDEARPVKQGGAEDGCRELAADGIEAGEVASVEVLVER